MPLFASEPEPLIVYGRVSAKVPEPVMVCVVPAETCTPFAVVTVTDVTVPPDPDPLDAAVIRPCASTVRSVFVYDPGVTAVLGRSDAARLSSDTAVMRPSGAEALVVML